MRDNKEEEEIAELIEKRKYLRAELNRIEESRKVARDYSLLKSLQVLNFRFDSVTGELETVEMKMQEFQRK